MNTSFAPYAKNYLSIDLQTVTNIDLLTSKDLYFDEDCARTGVDKGGVKKRRKAWGEAL